MTKLFISNPGGGGGGASGTASITGGTATGLTALGIRSTGAAFDLTLATSEVLTAGRTLSFNVVNSDRTLTIPATGTAALLGTAQTFSAANIFSVNGAASAPAISLTGTMFSNGTATTTKPLNLIEPVGTTSTGWSPNGTFLGINGPTGAVYWRYLDCLLDGVSKAYIRKDGLIHSDFGLEVGVFYNSGGGQTGYTINPNSVNGMHFLSLTTGLFGFISSQALSGAGAISITATVTKFTSTGVADALTLADGFDGQIKIIQHVVDGGSGVLTPTTKTGYTTITFTNAGETVTLMFNTTVGWFVIASRGVTIA